VSNQPAGFPYARSEAFTLGEYSEGISVGTGGGRESYYDCQLHEPITAGLSYTTPTKTIKQDSNGCCIEYLVTLTNSSETDPVTIREIGYKQKVKGMRWSLGGSAEDSILLLDRTVLDPAVVIPPKAAVTITYTLRSVEEDKTVDGVKIVSWAYGSDEDVAAMIDAAREGTIDLHEDGGWCIGDMRTIHVGAFLDGAQNTKGDEDLDIQIFRRTRCK